MTSPLLERFCFDPPQPPWGGESDWDDGSYSGGQTPFETEVTYSCGFGKHFIKYTENGTVHYDKKTIKCHWNTTWMPEELVSWPSCNGQTVMICVFLPPFIAAG